MTQHLKEIPADVKKNIKLSITEYTSYTLTASFITGALGFFSGTIQWAILRKQKRKTNKTV